MKVLTSFGFYIVKSLVEVRQGSDYDDFYIISKEEVTLQLQNACCFVSETGKYLKVYTLDKTHRLSQSRDGRYFFAQFS